MKKLFHKKTTRDAATSDLERSMLLGMSIDPKGMVTTESYRVTQRLKRKILRKHMILSNINLALKLTMILFSLASLIFFSVISSGGATPDSDIRESIRFGHLVFIWPVIISGIVLIAESLLFVYIYEKRKKISLLYTDSSFGGMKQIRKLSIISLVLYSISFVFIVVMFGSWFAIIDSSFGDYYQIFDKSFQFYSPFIQDLKVIYIILSGVMIAIEVAILSSLIAIFIFNKKYRKDLANILPKAASTMSKRNTRM